MYLVREDLVDAFVYRWYDITEYEWCERSASSTDAIKPRRVMSPLTMMVMLDQRRFDLYDRRTFADSVIADWMTRTVDSNRRMLVGGSLVQLFFAFLLLVYEMDEQWLRNMGGLGDTEIAAAASAADVVNDDDGGRRTGNASFVFCSASSFVSLSTPTRLGLEVFLVVYSIVFVVLMTCAYFRLFLLLGRDTRHILRDLRGWKYLSYWIQSVVIRAMRGVSCLVVFVEIIVLHRLDGRGALSTVVDVLRIWHGIVFLFSLLSASMQISRRVGHIVIDVRQMSMDMYLFSTMLFLFTVVFARLEMLFVNAHSNVGCVPDFADHPSALYSMFLAFVNMKHFTDYDVRSPAVLHIHHVGYVFLAGVLLFHLLIAMFSNTVARVERNRDALVVQELLAVVTRVNVLMFGLPAVRRVYMDSYTRRIRENFVCRDGRVFIVKMRSAVAVD